LVYAFDEDAVTLAWDAVHAAGLRAGTTLAVQGVALPAWWWQGTQIQPADEAPQHLEVHDTRAGPIAIVANAPLAAGQLEQAARAWPARELSDEEHARLASAQAAELRESDVPMGAYVTPTRYEEVLIERMRMPHGVVASWTRIAEGAAPSEFQRMQQAMGPYSVVLVDFGGKQQTRGTQRTVGICIGEEVATGAEVRPVLRRLMRQDGSWRYGVKFAVKRHV
jgi:uncharacterized OB-fold protein